MKNLKRYLFYGLAVVVLMIASTFWMISLLFTIAKIMAIVGVILFLVEYAANRIKKHHENPHK